MKIFIIFHLAWIIQWTSAAKLQVSTLQKLFYVIIQIMISMIQKIESLGEIENWLDFTTLWVYQITSSKKYYLLLNLTL